MLLAEIHGKNLGAARDNEDYLTSTVFGHLRYVPPGPFWDEFLKRAKGLPGPDQSEASLEQVLANSACSPSYYSGLEVQFWKSHPRYGEPDVLLVFSGKNRLPLVILIEAKLWSGKSGIGEHDQLSRYLRILDDLDAMGLRVDSRAPRFLVYLTPRDALAEVKASCDVAANVERARERMFRLQWQDVLAAAESGNGATPLAEPTTQTVLRDVARFLRALGLAYFNGFTRCSDLREIGWVSFYRCSLGGFRGFGRVAELGNIEARKGAWV